MDWRPPNLISFPLSIYSVIPAVCWAGIQKTSCGRATTWIPVPDYRSRGGRTALGEDGTSPTTDLGDDVQHSRMTALSHSCSPSIPSFPQSVGRESRKHLVAEQLHGSPITALGEDGTSPTTDLEDDVQHSRRTIRPRLQIIEDDVQHSGMTKIAKKLKGHQPLGWHKERQNGFISSRAQTAHSFFRGSDFI